MGLGGGKEGPGARRSSCFGLHHPRRQDRYFLLNICTTPTIQLEEAPVQIPPRLPSQHASPYLLVLCVDEYAGQQGHDGVVVLDKHLL